ncbi:MAG TPA: peptidylprolyl isomerase, partial [Povalibacter sp.]
MFNNLPKEPLIRVAISRKLLHYWAVCAVAAITCSAVADAAAPAKTMADVLAASKPDDWRALEPQNTLYMDIPQGRVVIELTPQFAPRHADNVRALVREGYFDGLAIIRSQDNYVVQWGDPDEKRLPKVAKATLPAEFTRPASGLHFTVLPDPDTYAPQTGFVDGFPAARDSESGAAWPVHCYAMVGAGRDVDVNSGGGTSLYVVTGHAPRQLDRNITLLGRVVQGMELLSVVPRGPGPMGFYEKRDQDVPIRRIRVAADVPPAERIKLEVLRTDTATFTDLIEARR